jgi:CubicO group peptidase (beta-lactamase class C family)
MMQELLLSLVSTFFFLLYTSSLPISTKSNWDNDKEQRMDNFVDALMECRDSAGMFVALVKDGEVAYTSGYGYRDLERQLPVDTDTRFNIGSLFKAFTTALAADAINKSPNVSWDTPLKEVLGDSLPSAG